MDNAPLPHSRDLPHGSHWAPSSIAKRRRIEVRYLDTVGIRQVFMRDVLPATLVATFVACCSGCIYGTVSAWMPLYLSTEKYWPTAQYSTFYVF